jgi:hypothetical protein
MDYKKYSLENLENWMHDAVSSGEATPQEIYDTIKKVVREQYDYHQYQSERSKKLLDLLDGVKELELDLNTVLAESYYYEGLSVNTEDKILSCDKDDPSPECKKEWTNFWEDSPYPLYVSEDGDVWVPDSVTKEDKVVKWQLPVQVDGLTGDCFVEFPDDLLEAANLKEGDTVECIDRKDGSFELRKVNGIK